MKGRTLLLPAAILFLVLFFAGSAFSQDLRIRVREYTLKNGMKVLILPRHNLPVFTGFIQMNGGSVMEHPGITGISHLLEHMMFKGTRDVGTWNYKAEIPLMKEIDRLADLWYREKAKLRNAYGGGNPARLKELSDKIKRLLDQQRKYIIKDELWGTYLENGGEMLNASTGNETVQYYVSLPANRLELWAYLESDRMANPVLREFYSERDVVNEERRMGDNEPSYRLYKEFIQMVLASSPYRWPVVGYESDISTVRREDAESYFRRYYAPNNAVAVVVGDVNPEEVMSLMRKYFEKIPSQPPPDPVMTMEVEQQGERRIEMEADANPTVMIGYHGAQLGSKEDFALDVAAAVLSRGRTGRFYRNLVEKGRKALSVYAMNMSFRYAGVFMINAATKAPVTPVQLEAAIYEELERLKKEPVGREELEKIHNNLEADFIRTLESDMWMAFKLGNSQTLTGDWRNVDERAHLKAVTPEEIMKAAAHCLVRKNRTVATLVKAEKTKKEGQK